MQRSIALQFAIKFCVKLNKLANERLAMIEERFLLEDSTNKVLVRWNLAVFSWNKTFKDRRKNVDDKQNTGHPSNFPNFRNFSENYSAF